MKQSIDRILTTHVGSLPRPPELLQIVAGRSQSESRAIPEIERHVTRAVDEVVAKQTAAGIDIANDGEVSKASFTHYVAERISGLDGPARPQARWIEEGM